MLIVLIFFCIFGGVIKIRALKLRHWLFMTPSIFLVTRARENVRRTVQTSLRRQIQSPKNVQVFLYSTFIERYQKIIKITDKTSANIDFLQRSGKIFYFIIFEYTGAVSSFPRTVLSWNRNRIFGWNRIRIFLSGSPSLVNLLDKLFGSKLINIQPLQLPVFWRVI